MNCDECLNYDCILRAWLHWGAWNTDQFKPDIFTFRFDFVPLSYNECHHPVLVHGQMRTVLTPKAVKQRRIVQNELKTQLPGVCARSGCPESDFPLENDVTVQITTFRRLKAKSGGAIRWDTGNAWLEARKFFVDCWSPLIQDDMQIKTFVSGKVHYEGTGYTLVCLVKA